MDKPKKLNKLKVGITIFLIVMVFSLPAFGRYVYNTIMEAYFSARQFYFSSDILIMGGTTYTYDNWGGIDVYDEIGFDLYSYNNELSKLTYDLDYIITCESLNPDKIQCSVAGTNGATTANGTISATTNTSRVNILVTPIAEISEGETVKVKVTAKTEVPYKKEISCTFSLYVRLPEGNSYSIEDEVGRDYALLKLVNRGETATQGTLEFDPRELRLDLNDEIYTDSSWFVEVETTRISGEDYINKITFNIPKESSKNVKFYKVDKSQNYSYPGVEETSAITVDY